MLVVVHVASPATGRRGSLAMRLARLTLLAFVLIVPAAQADGLEALSGPGQAPPQAGAARANQGTADPESPERHCDHGQRSVEARLRPAHGPLHLIRSG